MKLTYKSYPCGRQAAPQSVPDYCPAHGISADELKAWALDNADYEDAEVGIAHEAYKGGYYHAILRLVERVEKLESPISCPE